MNKIKQTSTKLLVRAITAVAIIAATTTFAAQQCNTTPDGIICQGGGSFQSGGVPGVGGAHYEVGTPITDPDFDSSGDSGHGSFIDDNEDEVTPGGNGGRILCESINQPDEVCTSVDGSGGP